MRIRHLCVVVAILLIPFLSAGQTADDSQYEDLARYWAPYIFQDTDDAISIGRIPDYITDWTYDGDLDPTNNWDNIERFDLAASAYYAVIESVSHYFISYLFYHPRDSSILMSSKAQVLGTHEHDLEGVTMLLRKPATQNADLVLMYTQAHGDSYYFSNEPTLVIPGCPDQLTSWDHLDNGWGNPHRPLDENPHVFFVGHSPCVFIESEGHGVGQIGRALEFSTEGFDLENQRYDFYGGDGVIYYPSPSNSAGVPDPAVATPSVEYRLLPFHGELWRSRHSDHALFDDYQTIETNRGIVLPNMGKEFRAADQFAGAHPPWAWGEMQNCYLDCDACGLTTGRLGDYFLDPAEFISHHVHGLAELTSPDFFSYRSNVYLIGDNWIELNGPIQGVIGESTSVSWSYGESSGGTGLSGSVKLWLDHAEGSEQIGTAPLSAGSLAWSPVSVPGPGPYTLRATVDSEVGTWLHAEDTAPFSIDTGCPVLAFGDLSSGHIDTQETCVFEVQYSDPNGDPPTTRQLVIDGSRIWTMNPVGAVDPLQGTLYQVELSGGEIGCGDHSLQFRFGDGNCGTVYYPETGSINGPVVEGAAPSLYIYEPSGNDVVDIGAEERVFTIRWRSQDPDSLDVDDLTLDLYWDDDEDPSSGLQLIAADIQAGDGHPIDGSYLWDMSGLGEGDYYVLGILTDACGSEDRSYSLGIVHLGSGGTCIETWERTPGGASAVGGAYRLVVDESGVWHVFTTQNDPDLILHRSRNPGTGAQWSLPVTVAECTDDTVDLMSVSCGGIVLDVAFEKHAVAGVGSSEIYHVRSLDGGDTWSGEHRVTPADDSASRFPSVATSGDVVHIAWMDFVGDDTIHYARSINGGANWSERVLSNPTVDLTATNDAPSLVANGNDVYLSWTDGAAADGIHGVHFRRSTDGGVNWGPDLSLITGHEGVQNSSCVVAGDAIHVVWDDDDDAAVYLATSLNQGNSFTQARQISFDGHHEKPTPAYYDEVIYVFREGRDDTLTCLVSYDRGEDWCAQIIADQGGDDPRAFAGSDHVGVISNVPALGGEIVVHSNPRATVIVDPGIDPPVDGPGRPITALIRATPNPFNPSTTIHFEVARPGEVSIGVYDLTGRLVRSLVSREFLPAGPGQAVWDGRTGRGRMAPTGTYVVRMSSDPANSSMTVTLIK